MSMSVPAGLTCSLEDYLLSQDVPPNTSQQLQCLAPTDYIGLTLIVVGASCSLLAIAYVLYCIVKRMCIIAWSKTGSIFNVFKGGVSILMLSLLLAEVLQAIGGVMSIRWMMLAKVEVGSYCTTQGVMQQLGETVVALATLTIAIHTCIGVVFNTGITNKITALAVASLSWIPVGFVVLIGNLVPRGHRRQYIAPTPYWCWISQPYLHTWRIGGEYLWLWLALIVSLVAHLFLVLWARGFVRIKNLDPDTSTGSPPPDVNPAETAHWRKVAATLLVYPLVYCITIVPATAVRWIGFGQESGGRKSSIPPAATFAVVFIHALGGMLDAVLLLSIRRFKTVPLFAGIQDASDSGLQWTFGTVPHDQPDAGDAVPMGPIPRSHASEPRTSPYHHTSPPGYRASQSSEAVMLN